MSKTSDQLEAVKKSLAEEKDKEIPDSAKIARLEESLRKLIEAAQREEAAQAIQQSDSVPLTEAQKARQAAVKSAEEFSAREDVTNVRDTTAKLTSGKQEEVKVENIREMQTHANAIVSSVENQEKHKQHQIEAQKLKEQLADKNLSPEARKEAERDRAKLIEAIGDYKAAETVVKKQALVAEINAGNAKPQLKKVASTEAQPAASSPEQEKELKKQKFLLNNALDKGEITQAEFDAKMKALTSPAVTGAQPAAPSPEQVVQRDEETRKRVGAMLRLPDNPNDVSPEQRAMARAASEALKSNLTIEVSGGSDVTGKKVSAPTASVGQQRAVESGRTGPG